MAPLMHEWAGDLLRTGLQYLQHTHGGGAIMLAPIFTKRRVDPRNSVPRPSPICTQIRLTLTSLVQEAGRGKGEGDAQGRAGGTGPAGPCSEWPTSLRTPGNVCRLEVGRAKWTQVGRSWRPKMMVPMCFRGAVGEKLSRMAPGAATGGGVSRVVYSRRLRGSPRPSGCVERHAITATSASRLPSFSCQHICHTVKGPL